VARCYLHQCPEPSALGGDISIDAGLAAGILGYVNMAVGPK
jgi:hypothetical protein